VFVRIVEPSFEFDALLTIAVELDDVADVAGVLAPALDEELFELLPHAAMVSAIARDGSRHFKIDRIGSPYRDGLRPPDVSLGAAN
jgi:hypothetical protein